MGLRIAPLVLMLKQTFIYLKLSVLLSLLITLLITQSGCSDFGQPMGIPNKSEPQTEESDEFSEDTTTADEANEASVTKESSESSATAAPSTSTKAVAAPKPKTFLKREIPWVELAALNQGVALSADGEVDVKQMITGCNSLASHEAEFKKQVQYITDYSLDNVEQQTTVEAKLLWTYPLIQNFPVMVFNRINTGGANSSPSGSLGIDCKLQQTTSVLGAIIFASKDDKTPTIELALKEHTKILNPTDQSPWMQKSIELKRVLKKAHTSENLYLEISRANHVGKEEIETYHARIVQSSEKQQDDSTLISVYKVTLTKFVLSESVTGNQLAPSVLHESSEAREFNIEVQKTVDGKQRLVRFHRPLEPLPEPWLQDEDGILKSFVNVITYFDVI